MRIRAVQSHGPPTQEPRAAGKSAGKALSRWVAGLALCVALGNGNLIRAVPVSDLPDLSGLSPYTTFGNFYNDNLVTINGDVGISKNGTLLAPNAQINGTAYLDTGVSVSIGAPTHITGGIVARDLSASQAEVFTASAALKNLAANVTLGNVTSGQNFTGNGAVTVVNMNSLTLGSGNITFTGGANDYFVLNIAHGLSLTGSASIVGNGVDGSHILVNLYDTSGADLGVIAHIGDVINGTLLIPYDQATLHGLNGAIWSGGKEITLMSGATVTSVPFNTTVPDGGSSLVLAGLGLGLVIGAKRKLLS